MLLHPVGKLEESNLSLPSGHGPLRLGHLHSGAVAGVRVWLMGCGVCAVSVSGMQWVVGFCCKGEGHCYGKNRWGSS